MHLVFYWSFKISFSNLAMVSLHQPHKNKNVIRVEKAGLSSWLAWLIGCWLTVENILKYVFGRRDDKAEKERWVGKHKLNDR